MSEPRIRATFITIERPLLPPPPLDSKPSWYYSNTLGFYDSAGKKVWEQEIPEAELHWVESNNSNQGDVFDKYFSRFEVFKDGDFGWQLRFQVSHERAKVWLLKMMQHHVEEHHKQHFAISA